ncbi:DUF6121 family protein [Microbacterium sp. W1N]|uniref:DUF6121 family protein n=1 Tax=Microbacterium festucae TaxID=2977531 RepID=UPI0021C0986E|nr:DUF6121 family protein [Microbacterium festucae]MCT9819107.1 DUF6121 family protein [Microbacterium festucae]
MALAFATVGFFALVIAGFGLASLATGAEVIGSPGLGQLPGILGTAVAVVGFATTLWSAVRRPQPTYLSALWVTAAAVAGYLVGLAVGALVQGADPARAVGAAGQFAISWFSVLLAGCALVAAWCGIALVRTRAHRPRWPWEDADDE